MKHGNIIPQNAATLAGASFSSKGLLVTVATMNAFVTVSFGGLSPVILLIPFLTHRMTDGWIPSAFLDSKKYSNIPCYRISAC